MYEKTDGWIILCIWMKMYAEAFNTWLFSYEKSNNIEWRATAKFDL